MTASQVDLEAIFAQVRGGDPIGAAYRLEQQLGAKGPGRAFYEAGSLALGRRDELGEDALRFARLVFAEAVERDPSLGEAHHDLATTMRELGMADDAIPHYRRALELMGEDVDSIIGLGAAQADAGRLDEAIATLRSATEKHPESGQAYANLGVALEAAGRDDEAAGAYAKAVARFDAALLDAPDDETAAEVSVRRRWSRIQHAELLERLLRWPQAIVEYRRLYEEEQAIAEAEEQAAAAAEEDEDGGAEDEAAVEPAPLADGPTPLPDGGAGETVLGGGEAEREAKMGLAEPDPAHDHDHDDHDHDHGDHDHEHCDHDHDPDHHDHGHDDEDDEDEAGRVGLERVFTRLVQLGRFDLAYIVLDDLGGEIADGRTRATYAIYDPGDGASTIMVEHWDGGARERLDPATPTKSPR